MDRTGVNWTFTPDQFALAWARTDGDRIPYPLAVRRSARDTAEREAQLPELNAWCDEMVDADVEAALRVLANPTVCVEVFGERGAESEVRPVRVLGAAAGNIAVVAAQRPGAEPDRGGEVRLYVGGAKTLPARVVSTLPENVPGGTERLTAPLAKVNEDSRDLVTVPVSGPTVSARIRRLLKQPRDGIGQLVVSVRRDDELRPFGVLCWIDVAGDGRYAVRTGADVDVTPVGAEAFTAVLRPMVTAAARSVQYAEQW
ncbi:MULTISPECIES: ESX secretion-associated protein EspG [unclassified Nocardia]|uniref:ESX secretion-associated protein EspG n=1 Tax=unclassified Nocardia TaxID=2637762 RepID=UPI001CE439D5|nr:MULTISPECIES: ESX secretion-associated protein EspG [unclassified Nocardia]